MTEKKFDQNLDENIIRINSIKEIQKKNRISSSRTKQERKIFVNQIHQLFESKKKEFPNQTLYIEITISNRNDQFKIEFLKKIEQIPCFKHPELISKYGNTYKSKILIDQFDLFEKYLSDYYSKPNNEFLDDVKSIIFINSLNLETEGHNPNRLNPTNLLIQTQESFTIPKIKQNISKCGILGTNLIPVGQIQNTINPESKLTNTSKEAPVNEPQYNKFIIEITEEQRTILERQSIIKSIIKPNSQYKKLKSQKILKFNLSNLNNEIIQSRFVVVDEDYLPQANSLFEPILNNTFTKPEINNSSLKEDCCNHGSNVVNLIAQGIYENTFSNSVKLPLIQGYFLSPFHHINYDPNLQEIEYLDNANEFIINLEKIIQQDPSIKIINISLNFNQKFEKNDVQLDIARKIDELAFKYRDQVIFMISLGQLSDYVIRRNNINPKKLLRFHSEIAEILPNMLMDPTTSVFALIIGNVHRKNTPDLSDFNAKKSHEYYDTFSSSKKEWEFDILTRTGPTIFQIPKPDFVSGFFLNDNVNNEDFGNIGVKLTETSYNCARVARDILIFWDLNPKLKAQEVVALLIANSKGFDVKIGTESPTASKLKAIQHNHIGFGIIEFHDFYYLQRNSIFLVGTKEITQNQIGYLEIPLPDYILQEKCEKFFVFGISYITTVAQDVNKTYLPYYITAELYDGDELHLREYWESGDRYDDTCTYKNEFLNPEDPQIQYNQRNPHKRFIFKRTVIKSKLFLKFAIENMDKISGNIIQPISLGIKLSIPNTNYDLKESIRKYLHQLEKKSIKILGDDEIICKEKKKQRPSSIDEIIAKGKTQRFKN